VAQKYGYILKNSRTIVAIGNPERHVRKASHCGNKEQQSSVHMPWSLYHCLFAPHVCMVLFFVHIPFVVNHTF